VTLHILIGSNKIGKGVMGGKESENLDQGSNNKGEEINKD
jgi:hypothetical protein